MAEAAGGPIQVRFIPISHADLRSGLFVVQASIRGKLETRFEPKFMDVINESYMHNVPKGVALKLAKEASDRNSPLSPQARSHTSRS